MNMVLIRARILPFVGLTLLCTLLVGCVASNRMGGAIMTPQVTIPDQPAEPEMAPQASQPITGTELAAPGDTAQPGAVASPHPPGTVRVALLLPLSAQGTTGNVAQSLKNAADMAMAEFSGASIDLVVKDERGTPDGAREAAKQAVAEGASAVIGP